MAEFMEIPIGLIKPSPFQMRSRMDPEALDQLADSLKRDGQQRPIKARPSGYRFEIVFGHRTVEAAKQVGWETVQAVVEDLGDEAVMWAQYAENEYREDVSDYDRARWLRDMIEQFGHTQQQIAEKIGKTQQWVSYHLQMLKLEGLFTTRVVSSLTEFQARTILSAPEEILPDVCREIEQFYEENEDIPSASTIRDIIDWKAMDLEEIITVPSGTPEPQPEAEAIHSSERPGIIEGFQADEAPAPLTDEEKHERIEQLRKRANEFEEPLQDAYREIHPYASSVGTSVMSVSDLRQVLKNHPELYESVRASVSAGMDFHAAYHDVDDLEDIPDLPRVRRQDSSVDNLLKAYSMLKKWKPSSEEVPAPLTEAEVEDEVKADTQAIQNFIADTLKRLPGADEEWLISVLKTKFHLADREARDELRSFKQKKITVETPTQPRRYEPERAPTCRCPLCGRDGADKNLILTRVEDPELAQLTLNEFIREAL